MSDTITTGRLYGTRPQLEFDGESVPHLREALTELAITHSVQGISRCLLRITNLAVDANGDTAPLMQPEPDDFGRMLTVRDENGEPLFTGQVYAVGAAYEEGQPPSLILRAEGVFGRLQAGLRTRQFNDMTIGDVLEMVFAGAGVPLQLHIVDDQPVYPVIRQHNEDDFDFVRGLAARIGADLWENGSTAHVVQRVAWRREPVLTLAYGSNLHRFNVRADLSEQFTGIRVTGRTPSGTTASGLADTVTPALRLNDGQSGPGLLDAQFAESVTGLTDNSVQSPQDAEALAQTHLNRRATRFVTASGATGASAAVRAGTVVDLWRLGAPFDGKYYVVTVRHRFDREQGFRTEFDLERADLFTQESPERKPTLRERIAGNLGLDRLRDET